MEFKGNVEEMTFSEQNPKEPFVRINASQLESYLEVIGPFKSEDMKKPVKIILEW